MNLMPEKSANMLVSSVYLMNQCTGGATSMLDVRQAEQLVSTAAETIPDLERQIEQRENFLSTLLGNNPGPIARGITLTEQPHVPAFRRDFPPAYWSDDATFARRKHSRSRPTRELEWPKQRTSQKFP